MNEHLEVNWHEGLFLRPHQLQHSARNTLAQLRDSMALARPFAWGFSDLVISEAEIETGKLSIRSCSLWLKDGTRLRAPENAQVEARDFLAALNASGGGLNVYLGLPRRMDAEPNTQALQDPPPPHPRRYLATTAEISDENTGDNIQRIQGRKYNVKLLFEGEDQTRFDVLRLGRITREGFDQNKPRLSSEHIPPILNMEAWPWLRDQVKDIYYTLQTKNNGLAAQVAGRNVNFGSTGAGGPEAMLKLNITNRSVAHLRQLTSVGALHPFDVFMELTRLAGDLALFSPERLIPELPFYDHDDIGRSYFDLLQLLRKYLNILLPTTFERLRFTPEGDFLTVLLREKWLGSELQFFLGVESEKEPGDIDEQVGWLYIGSPTDLERAKTARDRILGFTRVHRAPIGLPDRPDIHYYRIEREGDYWKNVVAAKRIGCYGHHNKSLEIYLYILLKKPEEGGAA